MNFLNGLIRVLTFLKLVDEHDRSLSLTSIGLIIVLARVATAGEPSWPALGTLVATLMLYAHKRWLAYARGSGAVSELGEKLDALTNRMNASELKSKLGQR